MHELSILLTFAGGLGAALVFGYIARLLKLSPIVGYLLAGVVVGPYTPGFVASQIAAEAFAEIGVILLLFGVGLRFHLRELIAVWRVAIPGAVIQSGVSTIVLALLLRLIGWSWDAGIILGLAISVASTVVMSLVLADSHDLHSPIGNIAIGWTVVEDLITVTLLIVLPMIYGPAGSGTAGIVSVMGLTAAKAAGLVAVVAVLGRWVIPWALDRISKTHSRELFTLAVLVLASGIAFGSSKVFGMSVELGAFLAGLAVGQTEFAARAGADALPMRDAFAVLFFVSVGMMFDPSALIEAPMVIVIMLAVVLFGKPLAAMLVMRAFGKPPAIAVPAGAAFSQIGEFSFVLGTAARGLGLIDNIGWSALVTVSILSIGFYPSFYRMARRTVTKASPMAPLPTLRPQVDFNHCILVGFGPVGQTIYRLLSERGAEITVIELNIDTVRRLRAKGVKAIYGDVLRSGTLHEAGIATAGGLILSADVDDAAEITRQARLLNPDLRILVRCSHLRDVAKLYRSGATVVAAGEAEVAVALAEAVIAGGESDQKALAQQRAALRQHLYDTPTTG